MSGEFHVTVVLSVALVVVGLLLAILAPILLWRGHLAGKNVIDLNTGEKLGGFVLKANAFGLIFLLGCVLVGLGVWVLKQNYEDRLSKLEKDYNGLHEAIAELKAFDQRLNLIFPDKDPPNPYQAVCHAFVLKKNENQEMPYDAHFGKGQGGLDVTFRDLKLGDYIHVEVEEQGHTWRSDDTPFGAAQLNMKLMQH
jgi:hypothetical protein